MPKNAQVAGGSVLCNFCQTNLTVTSWPVNCRREQISGPLVRWDYRSFRSSLGRCILPAPSWKYSSSCQWSSACRSATNQERKDNAAPVSPLVMILKSHRISSAYRKPFPNVSSVQPSILIERFSCFLWIIQVSFEYIWSFDAHLQGDCY